MRNNAIMKIGKINKLKESSATLAHIMYVHMTQGWLLLFGRPRLEEFFPFTNTMGGVGWGCGRKFSMSVQCSLFRGYIVEISDFRVGISL